MRRAALVVLLLVLAAGYVFLQTSVPSRDLATLAPGGAVLYLEARDFGALLRDWDTSKVKTDWLASGNYEVFSQSNLYQKLAGVYQEYGTTAGFFPDLKSTIGLAGTHSALALYGLRDVEFLYISRQGPAQFSQSALAAVRGKFEQRQAGGVTFYMRTDPASKRTVAFATAGGYLFLATRDDLVGRALALLAGGSDPSIASEPWYREASTAAPNHGELRLVMNLETLTKSVYFGSYWIQRNVSTVREFWAGAADLTRSPAEFSEARVFLRRPDAAAEPHSDADQTAVRDLIALVPPEAGMYKAFSASSAPDPATLIVNKLISAPPPQAHDWRYAPGAMMLDQPTGSEADLETRIDEPPLPAGAGAADAIGAVRSLVREVGVNAILEVQSSEPSGGTFVRTPAALVLAASGVWNTDEIRQALSSATGALWTVSELGTGWVPGSAGQHTVDRLDGLGVLVFAVRGPRLFVANDPLLLAAILDRAGNTPSGSPIVYAAGFRHARESARYRTVMRALDAANPPGGPAFFSDNLASLCRVFARVSEVSVRAEDRGDRLVQHVVYRIAP
jgi:hypothetical protein